MSKKALRGIGAFMKQEKDGSFTVTIAVHQIATREEGVRVAQWIHDKIVPHMEEIGLTVMVDGRPS